MKFSIFLFLTTLRKFSREWGKRFHVSECYMIPYIYKRKIHQNFLARFPKLTEPIKRACQINVVKHVMLSCMMRSDSLSKIAENRTAHTQSKTVGMMVSSIFVKSSSERIVKHRQILCECYFWVKLKISVWLVDYYAGISLAGCHPSVNAEVLQG